jgi:hypothetical protein
MQVLEGIPGERERLPDSEKVGLAERLRFLRFEQFEQFQCFQCLGL